MMMMMMMKFVDSAAVIHTLLFYIARQCHIPDLTLKTSIADSFKALHSSHDYHLCEIYVGVVRTYLMY